MAWLPFQKVLFEIFYKALYIVATLFSYLKAPEGGGVFGEYGGIVKNIVFVPLNRIIKVCTHRIEVL